MARNKRQTILLVHGLRGSHHGLLEIGELLEKDFDVVAMDLPGSGGTPELQEQNLDGHIEWLRKYIEDLGVKPVLVGHSMGSIIVSHYLEKYPETADERVVLLAPILRGASGKVVNRLLDGTLRGLLYPLSEKQRKRVLVSKQVSWAISHYLTVDRTKQQEIDEAQYRYSGRIASARSLYGDMEISTRHETKLSLQKKVLVIFGKKDRLTSYRLAREAARDAGAEYVEIGAAGHLINHERPREVAERIAEFLLNRL